MCQESRFAPGSLVLWHHLALITTSTVVIPSLRDDASVSAKSSDTPSAGTGNDTEAFRLLQGIPNRTSQEGCRLEPTRAGESARRRRRPERRKVEAWIPRGHSSECSGVCQASESPPSRTTNTEDSLRHRMVR